jgi:hypothetical protein
LEQKADLKLTLDKLDFGLMNLGILGNVEGSRQLEATIDDNREEKNGKPSSSGCPPIFVKEKVQFMLFKRKSK